MFHNTTSENGHNANKYRVFMKAFRRTQIKETCLIIFTEIAGRERHKREIIEVRLCLATLSPLTLIKNQCNSHNEEMTPIQLLLTHFENKTRRCIY